MICAFQKPSLDQGNKELEDCYNTAKSNHSQDISTLSDIGSDRVEGLFGSISGQKELLTLDIVKEGTYLALETAIVSYATAQTAGLASTVTFGRAASRAKKVINMARTGASYARAAGIFRPIEVARRNTEVLAALGVGISYTYARSGGFSGLDSGAAFADFVTGSDLPGFTIGLTSSAIQAIEDSGLSQDSVNAALSGVSISLAKSKLRIDQRLQENLADCDQKYGGN